MCILSVTPEAHPFLSSSFFPTRLAPPPRHVTPFLCRKAFTEIGFEPGPPFGNHLLVLNGLPLSVVGVPLGIPSFKPFEGSLSLFSLCCAASSHASLPPRLCSFFFSLIDWQCFLAGGRMYFFQRIGIFLFSSLPLFLISVVPPLDFLVLVSLGWALYQELFLRHPPPFVLLVFFSNCDCP